MMTETEVRRWTPLHLPRIRCESTEGAYDFDWSPVYWQCTRPATHLVKPGPGSFGAHWWGNPKPVRVCPAHAADAVIEGDRVYRFRRV